LKATLPLTSFTGGEWSSRLHGRVDIAKYSTACEVLENMVIYPHGGITRRMGMEYIEDAKVASVRLIPFEYNRDQTYVLEFGENYIRYYRDGAQIAPLGTPYETVTTFTAAEIPELDFAQSNDVLYIVHQNHSPLKLSRTGPDTFTLSTVAFTAAPADWVAASYPTSVTFFQSRLVLAGPAQKVWLSKVSDLENFTTGSNANDALSYTLSSTQNNLVQWVEPAGKLLIGTTGGEFSLSMPDNSAQTVQVRRESNFGSKTGRTQLIGNSVVYTSRDGRKIREMAYSFEADGYVSPELSLLSEHLTRPGIKEYDFAQNPDGILWTVMDDGTFAGFTYLKSQEVQGWHRHSTDGEVVSVCTIEGDTATEVWFAVTRNGATRIERMAQAFEGTSTNDVACAYLDSFLTYDGAAATVISGLDHLEGKTVRIMGDGYYLADKVVASGSITLERSCTKVVVGLPYTWRVVPLRLEGGSPTGVSQGKRKRIESLVVRMERSAHISYKIYGHDFEALIPTREFGQNFGEPIELFTGDKKIKLPNSWDRDGQFELKGDSPFPATILMIAADVTVNE
jgi:hypothetical protein